MRRLGYAALLFYFFGTAAVADQVTLKNGDRLTGTICPSAKIFPFTRDLAAPAAIATASIPTSLPN